MASVESIPSTTTTPAIDSTHRESRWLTSLSSPFALLASLKVTVVLFALSMFLVLFGTLAQVDKDMWEVMHDYFRCWIAIVDLQIFFPPAFFRSSPQVPGWFPYPGGMTLWTGLAINLLAAHLSRFKLQAKGRQRVLGFIVTGFAAALIVLIVLAAQIQNGTEGTAQWHLLWNAIRFSLVALWIGSVIGMLNMQNRRSLEFAGLVLACVVFGITGLYLVAKGDTVRLGDSSLRILWQLIQGSVAGIVLLAGSTMLFHRRGGIVVIHVGVGLIMFNELLVYRTAVEQQIVLAEGQSTSFARDVREVELAVIDHSPTDHDNVVVIPESRLRHETLISDDRLPFDLHAVEFLENTSIAKASPERVNLATTGVGKQYIAEAARSAGGAEAGQAIDVAAAYVTITPKEAPEQEETYLLAQHFGDADILLDVGAPSMGEKIKVGDKEYDVMLRYKRNYKPYRVTLEDLQKNDYKGTSTPRDYSSWITLADASRGMNRERIRIWMNNPLRYDGETFYQSNYVRREDGTEVTTLQVVTNAGWMIPYVACMLVWVGMLAHFSQTLLRFLRKTLAERVDRPVTGWAWALPLGIVTLFGIYAIGKAVPRSYEYQGMELGEFGKLPIVEGGRVKPIDTLARNTLRKISDKQALYVPESDEADAKVRKEPAIRWLADVISRNAAAGKHRVFRIDNLDVLDTLGLERRKGFLYSANEIGSKEDALKTFEKQATEAREVERKDATQLTFHQQKILETDIRLRTYTRLQNSFMPVPFPPIPTQDEATEDPERANQTRQAIAKLMAVVPRLNQELLKMEPPLVVPLAKTPDVWLPYAAAFNEAYVASVFSGERPDRRLTQWNDILSAYSRSNATDFNRAVTAYQKDLAQVPPSDFTPNKVQFESFFNSFQPFVVAMVLNIVVLTLTVASWLGWFEPLRRSAFAVLLLAISIHTFALIARIYISGRPPITNLYTSAVFVGWGAILFGVAIEYLSKLGIGNFVGAVIGFSTLFVAHGLAFGGDTFTVLQAVLDTQFWLATHVVCISFGYIATFVAGALAIAYIVSGALTRAMHGDNGKLVVRMIYGTLCFAIFFSFVGTVLGGLWADDSWGRFWGWDPKENGALMIVIWNAIILHARWGGMVRDRGLAALAVVGNVVTAWSWFGTNELGVGLHSYGFTKGVLANLLVFAVINLVVLGIALIPRDRWSSHRAII